MSDARLQGWTGKTVRIPKHDAKGQVISYRPVEPEPLLNIQTATGDWLPNIPASDVEVEDGAPVAQPAPAEKPDLSDLPPATLAQATLTAVERGQRVGPKAIERLARIVLQDSGRGA